MPTTTESNFTDCYADLKSFVAEWHRPVELSDGYTGSEVAEAEDRLGIRIPEALREFYLSMGKNKDFSYTQNCMSSPAYLKVDNSPFGKVIEFRRENQAGWFYFMRYDDASVSDPPVLFRWDEEGDWVETNGVLSDCLIQMVYTEIYWSAKKSYRAGGWIQEGDPFGDLGSHFVSVSPTQWPEANVKTDGRCVAITITQGGWVGQSAPEDANWVNLMARTKMERDVFMAEYGHKIVWDDLFLDNPIGDV